LPPPLPAPLDYHHRHVTALFEPPHNHHVTPRRPPPTSSRYHPRPHCHDPTAMSSPADDDDVNDDDSRCHSRPNIPATGDKRRDEGRIGRNARRRGGEECGGDDGDDLLVIVPRGFHYNRGDEGAGPGDNDGVCRCPPQSSTMTGGQAGTYVPPIPATSSTGAGVKPTCRPLRIHPPLLRLHPRYRRGVVCNPHAARPHSSPFTPRWGGFFFLQGFFDWGQHKSQTPPPSSSFIPPDWGEYLI